MDLRGGRSVEGRVNSPLTTRRAQIETLDIVVVCGHRQREVAVPVRESGRRRGGEGMRIMITFSIQPEKGDALIKDGTVGETMQSIFEDIDPEALYFTSVEGTRGGYCVINVDDASQSPPRSSP